ncbi:MAG: T9SS type A sorting domain-containing protein [Ignavibacteriales bacterium]|nr:T9SS type A sorting domain-containing protein [Ignavibacteriales bacterium]
MNSFPFTFDLPRDSLFDDLDEFEDFKDWVQSSMAQNGWAIMQTHETLPYSLLQDAIQAGLYEPVAAEWFELVCNWIYDQTINNHVWVATVANVTKYMKERDSYFTNLVSATSDKIQIELSDTLDNAIYNFPITADIIVPDNWNEITLIQGSTTSFYNSFFDGINFIVRVQVIPDAGMIELYNSHLTSVESIAEILPDDFILHQNYPNPFNPSTKIKFDLKNRSHVELSIFDMLGREITKLVDSEFESGAHEVIFDPKELASGIYFYKILVGNKQEVKKLILSK